MCKRVSFSNFLAQALVIGLLACLNANSVKAADTLQAVMARMQPKQAVSIQYRERKSMSLLSETWTGTGYFYAAPPDVMIKEQRTPEPELMGIVGTRLYYFKENGKQRFQGDLDDENALEMHLGAFKGLINGNLDYLLTLYNIDFSAEPNGWRLLLTAKDKSSSDTDVQVIMQGQSRQAADKLVLLLADGDRTEYLLTPAKSGKTITAVIQKFLQVLQDER